MPCKRFTLTFILLTATFTHAIAQDNSDTIFDAIHQIQKVSHAPQPKNNTYIFISFSMPDASINAWLLQAREHNIPVIIRGLIDNSFKATTLKLTRLSPSGKLSVVLDPTRFRQYHITQVPAIVTDQGEHFKVLYGDVSLAFALKKLEGL